MDERTFLFVPDEVYFLGHATDSLYVCLNQVGTAGGCCFGGEFSSLRGLLYKVNFSALVGESFYNSP